MNWRAFLVLAIAFLGGVFICLSSVLTFAGEPHGIEQFLLCSGAGLVFMPLAFQALGFKRKVLIALVAAYVVGIACTFYLMASLSDQPHAAQQFFFWIVAGAVWVPLTLQTVFDL